MSLLKELLGLSLLLVYKYSAPDGAQARDHSL